MPEYNPKFRPSVRSMKTSGILHLTNLPRFCGLMGLQTDFVLEAISTEMKAKLPPYSCRFLEVVFKSHERSHKTCKLSDKETSGKWNKVLSECRLCHVAHLSAKEA